MSSSQNSLPADQQTHDLKRALGPWSAIAVVVGNVIGSGIFAKPGNIATDGGQFGLIISVWVVGGVLCVLGALSFAELATMYPRAGGLYVFLREAYGRPVAFLFGWIEIIFGKPASIAALSTIFVGSLMLAMGKSATPTYVQLILAIALILGLAWVNVIGVLWGGRMQFLTTAIKAGFLAFMAVLPFVLTPFVDHGVSVANYATTITPQQVSLAAQVGAVLLAVMWAYNGWHDVTQLAEEVRQPQRNIPIALFGGIGVLMLLYVAANVAYHGVLTMGQMSQAGDHAAERMLDVLLGPTGKAAMAAVVMSSVFGAINSNLLLGPRISFAMGRDRVFFQSLGRVHVNFRTPALAIIVMALMSIFLLLSVTVAQWYSQGIDARKYDWELLQRIIISLQDATLFELLTNFVVFSASIFYMLGVLAVLILRWKHPDMERPYRTWGYPLTPLLFLAVYTWFMFQVYIGNPLEAHASFGLIVCGIPFYLGFRFWLSRRKP